MKVGVCALRLYGVEMKLGCLGDGTKGQSTADGPFSDKVNESQLREDPACRKKPQGLAGGVVEDRLSWLDT